VRIARSAHREVNRKILLTGRPGCGKTTLIKRVVKELALPAGGFYTEGKYGLDLAGLETIGVQALRTAMRTRKLVIVDEIGPMEIRSCIFRDAVSEALDTGAPILATISARSFPFTDTLKRRRDVTVIEVRPNNREQLVAELSDQFRV
jgi:nucleoside-triphosphatase